MADEQAGFDIDDLSDDDIIDRQDLEVELNQLEREKDEAVESIGDNDSLPEDRKAEQIKEVEDKYDSGRQKVIDDARDELRDKIYDEWYNGLEDPVDFLVEEQRLYSIEDLMKQPWIMIDVDEAAQDAVDTDGWAHFISLYDGDYQTTKNGLVYFRE
jgi:hypothetical protein